MRSTRKPTAVLVLCILCAGQIHSQVTIPATGGTATGSGGSATYSVGQLAWNIYSGSTGTVLEGVQQPYEISVETSIENTDYINLVCTVYPNPTREVLILVVESDDLRGLRLQLYGIDGALMLEKPVLDNVTEILMDHFISSVYYLRVIRDNRKIKVLKIIKL